MVTETVKYYNLGLLSFPDSQVEGIKINHENKLFEIYVDRAYLDKNPGVITNGGLLSIKNWEQFEIKTYTPEGGWDNNFDEIKDIPEFVASEKQIKLRGFGKSTGRWTEYTFINAQAEFIY